MSDSFERGVILDSMDPTYWFSNFMFFLRKKFGGIEIFQVKKLEIGVPLIVFLGGGANWWPFN